MRMKNWMIIKKNDKEYQIFWIFLNPNKSKNVLNLVWLKSFKNDYEDQEKKDEKY